MVNQPKKMAQRVNYPFMDKIRPFFTGILEGTPLVEVALEGLKREVPEEVQREYEFRIARRGSTEQIFAALLIERDVENQDRMVAAFQHRYNITKESFLEKMESSESSMNGYALLKHGERYVANTLEQVIRLFRSGNITSEKAQMELASIIFEDGTIGQAKELLNSGNVTSRFAKHVLFFKTGDRKGHEA